MQYRITDFVTTCNQSGSIDGVITSSANHQFDIIVTADTTNTLNADARVCLHVFEDPTNGDSEYFLNRKLSDWKIKYDINNDTSKYKWAVENGKGVIYWMQDEFRNEAYYDFKNILFDGRYTFDLYRNSHSDFSFSMRCYENKIRGYYAGSLQYLNNNLCLSTGTQISQNIFDTNTYSCIINTYSISNHIGNSCHDITLGDSCNNITLGNDCSNITLGNSCSNIKLGNGCQDNIFGNGCYDNTFGNSCHDIELKSNCYDNTFGNDCYSITLMDDCYVNTFEFNCFDNTLMVGCYSNTFGNECSNNTLGNGCSNNIFENECHSCILGDSCSYNTFGNSCNTIRLGNNCYSNEFGNGCNNNTLGIKCIYNIFGNICHDIILGDGYISNTFENDCSYIIFGINNELIPNCKYNHFGVGCMYIYIICKDDYTTGYVQNYTISKFLQGTNRLYETIDTHRNLQYIITVAKTPTDDIVQYCEADLYQQINNIINNKEEN